MGTPSSARRGAYTVRNGKKSCRGVLHQGEWLPIAQFGQRTFTVKDGSKRITYESSCRACRSCARDHRLYPPDEGARGYVDTDRVRFAILELVHRMGKVEAARYSGIGAHTLMSHYAGENIKMHKRTARKILLALARAREENIVRSRRDIRRGSRARGKPEQPPQLGKDAEFYVPSYAIHTQDRRADEELGLVA